MFKGLFNIQDSGTASLAQRRMKRFCSLLDDFEDVVYEVTRDEADWSGIRAKFAEGELSSYVASFAWKEFDDIGQDDVCIVKIEVLLGCESVDIADAFRACNRVNKEWTFVSACYSEELEGIWLTVDFLEHESTNLDEYLAMWVQVIRAAEDV